LKKRSKLFAEPLIPDMALKIKRGSRFAAASFPCMASIKNFSINTDSDSVFLQKHITESFKTGKLS